MDYSGLFKLDAVIQLDIVNYSFYEVGLKKFLAVASEEELVFFFINSQQERFEKNYFWDFLDNPIYCLCFEPSGTWVVIISDEKVLLVPFLPLFVTQDTFDCKWSLSSVTVLPLGIVPKPKSVVWWLTKESDNILIIGSKNGNISFYSLETQSVVAETKVSGEISDLQICFDDCLDLLTLLITGTKRQQWSLVLEHRSEGYNWLQQACAPDRRDGFMAYIKQLSKDKITLFTQGTSKDNTKPQSVEYDLKPTEYLPSFRKRSNYWSLTAQYVNGRHFLTAFELNEGRLFIESPEQNVPSRSLRPVIKADGAYTQGLWSQRLICLLTKNELEVHSCAFSVIQGTSPAKEQTLLWSADLQGTVHRAYILSAREIPSTVAGWKEPTFLCDLQLPRFNLEQCLVITTAGVFLMNTVCEPSEWLVGLITRGGAGVEVAAAAFGADAPALLRAAADLLLSRGKLAPAQYLYSLSQCHQDGWVARLGVFGRLQELSMYKPPTESAVLGNQAVTLKLLAILMKVANNTEEKFDTETKFTNLTTTELQELSSITASLGLWDLLPQFNIQKGQPNLYLPSLKGKNAVCRGALDSLLRQKSVVPTLLMDETQWFYDFIAENCCRFDIRLLKCLCLWLCPLQDQLRPVMRDLKQEIITNYTAKMPQLISTFMRVASAIDSKNPSTELISIPPTLKNINNWHNVYQPRRFVSAGLAHWAICDNGAAKILGANTIVDTELIGRVITVACGRHHTIVLTENGIYTAGDNTYGQLGVGSSWEGAIGDNASANGSLLHVAYDWQCPIAQISAGHYHSAVVDQGGRLYTWGWGVHGQLGLGSIDDEWSPQIVTKLLGRKVLNVGCGACHTVVLTKNGEVFAFGASVFGQLGNGSREKCSLPTKVPMCEPIESIAVGYFHTLALTSKGTLLVWGGSPQSVRAAHARRSQASESTNGEPHLLPQPVDCSNIQDGVAQIASGWHHSCLLSGSGALYTWGLNFDGQLGSGDRKQVPIPTLAKINSDIPKSEGSNKKSKDSQNDVSKALVACGGDFSVYIDDGGKIYVSGNTHLEFDKDSGKTTNRVIMMKTTKRVIKIPTCQNKTKFVFQPIHRSYINFPFDVNDTERNPLGPKASPLNSISDFKRKSWPDEIINILGDWIKTTDVSANRNMAAKLAFYKKMYPECLKFLLDDLLIARPDDSVYLAHGEMMPKDEAKIIVANVMSQRIKTISLSILNEQPYPAIDPLIYKKLPCGCDESKYLPKSNSLTENVEVNLSIQAANVVDKCLSLFPVNAELWEACFRLAKDFFLKNELSVVELESVLRKYMEANSAMMASAVMYSNDCVQYSKILSPKFYLNMCSDIMDSW